MIARWLLPGAAAAAVTSAIGWAALGGPKLSTSELSVGDRAGDRREGDTRPLGTRAACTNYNGLPPGFARDVHAGMVHLAGGTFTPGSRHGYADERPGGSVRVEPFWIDRTEVTNAQFTAFVQATGHVTLAEREGGAAVFKPHGPASAPPATWWKYEEGASWRHPEGAASDLRGRENHPVVQVALSDAVAYAHWLGRELPSEAQWEFAARGGMNDVDLPSKPKDQRGRPSANYWQGAFPTHDTGEDGYAGRAPVGCFAANAFGIHDVIGNVWEWTRDPYAGHVEGHCAATRAHPAPPNALTVVKGGSFLCSATFCARYRATARYPQEANMATAHVGFRTVRSDAASR